MKAMTMAAAALTGLAAFGWEYDYAFFSKNGAIRKGCGH